MVIPRWNRALWANNLHISQVKVIVQISWQSILHVSLKHSSFCILITLHCVTWSKINSTAAFSWGHFGCLPVTWPSRWGARLGWPLESGRTPKLHPKLSQVGCSGDGRHWLWAAWRCWSSPPCPALGTGRFENFAGLWCHCSEQLWTSLFTRKVSETGLNVQFENFA